MKIEQGKGILLIGFGLFFLMINGWVTIRILTLILALILINFGFIKLGYPSLIECLKNLYVLLKFW